MLHRLLRSKTRNLLYLGRSQAESLNKSANPSCTGKYNLEMAHQDISKALNSTNYYVSSSLQPYFVFKMLRETEVVEFFDLPKQWVDQQDQVLEDITSQGTQIDKLSDFVKPIPPKMSLSYKFKKFQNPSTKCKLNQQILDIPTSSDSIYEPPFEKSDTLKTSYPPNYIPPLKIILAMPKECQHKTNNELLVQVNIEFKTYVIL